MRVLISGSRGTELVHKQLFEAILTRFKQLPRDAVIVHGHCPRGVDALADRAARQLRLKVERHAADWEKNGKAAGPIRNGEMVALGADLALVWWDGVSSGTRSFLRKLMPSKIPLELCDLLGQPRKP